MAKTIWHCHIAVSLDGKIARPDGSFDWLEGYPPQEFGLEAFLTEVDAIVMGRTTYETVRGFGDWPHPDKPTLVVTSRPLTDPPRRRGAAGRLRRDRRRARGQGLQAGLDRGRWAGHPRHDGGRQARRARNGGAAAGAG